MTFRRYKDLHSILSKREQAVFTIILVAIGLFTVVDVYEDLIDGAPPSHIVPEVVVILVTVGAALYIVGRMLGARARIIDDARHELSSAKESAQEWRSKAEGLRKGISDAISAQFDKWGLTPAEQEVSFLLLKGLSIEEVAEVRQTKERTVRQQAHEVYKKSGLSGRAQLSAFFMEDLFER